MCVHMEYMYAGLHVELACTVNISMYTLHILCVSSYSVKKIWSHLEIVGNPKRDSEFLAKKITTGTEYGKRIVHYTVQVCHARLLVVRLHERPADAPAREGVGRRLRRAAGRVQGNRSGLGCLRCDPTITFPFPSHFLIVN